MTNQLPPEIYRRRRIAALVVLVVILVLLGWGITALVKRGSDTTEPVNVTRDDGRPVEPSARPSQPYPADSKKSEQKGERGTGKDGSKDNAAGDGKAKGEPDQSASDAAALANKKDCTLADLQITATSDQPNYGSEQPELVMTVRNPTGGECRIDLDTQQLRFEVYDLATYQPIWSDVDCNRSEGKGELVLAPGEEVNYGAKWSRLVSAPGKCTEAERTEAPAGSYLFYGLIGDNNSEAYTFNLR